MYHALLVLGLCLAYVCLAYGFAWFFETGRPVRLSWRAAGAVAAVAIAADAFSATIPDWQLANRALHVFGGGFVAYLACVLAARAAGLAIGRARFLALAALAVTALGVGNELLELVLQRYFSLTFAAGPLDTWLDLASNTVGIALGALLLLPLVPARAFTQDSMHAR
ncbi:MAG: hypothetical protein KGI78_04430 [Patescibacteria group bacterium]|nr:hypothetical protein [Patescibacteria group bacterium]MDE1945344.1 hypothetical protein [Patescibacteria group bacterium]MDE2058057.1 hypothetical protein [Patescibacteria group bacterium]